MDILKQTTVTAIDVSATETTVFTHTMSDNSMIMLQVVLSNIVGAGNQYFVRFYIDGILVIPSQDFIFDSTSGIVHSGAMVGLAGSVVTVTVLGVNGDNAINVTTTLMDTSPVSITEITEILEPQIQEIIAGSFSSATIRPTTTVLSPLRLKTKKKCKKSCP